MLEPVKGGHWTLRKGSFFGDTEWGGGAPCTDLLIPKEGLGSLIQEEQSSETRGFLFAELGYTGLEQCWIAKPVRKMPQGGSTEHLPSPFFITLGSACPQINEKQVILDHQIQGGARHSLPRVLMYVVQAVLRMHLHQDLSSNKANTHS